MNIGLFGTGVVGHTLATKMVELGHAVKMGSRTADNPRAAEWVTSAASKGKGAAAASQGTFADAAAFGELLFNCTGGMVSLAALQAAGAKNLAGKILVDVSNPLDFSKGRPPTLSVANTDSLGEQLQRAFPATKVVKALNTVNATVMVTPGAVANGEHDMFVSGDDAAAKGKVTEILKGWFGWKHVIDLGDITAARGQEMVLPIWLRLMGALGTPMFNLHVVR